MGSPIAVHSLRETRRAPQTPTEATSATTIRRGPKRPILDRPGASVITTAANAAFTDATSIDTPYTPQRLANCAIGSTLAWLYPRSTHGNPMYGTCSRPSSVATQTTGAATIAPGPAVHTSRRMTTANTAGQSARHATRAAFTSTATHDCKVP